MTDVNDERIIPVLRRLARAMSQEKGFSSSDLEKAKALATKLYVMHTNRDLSLSTADFQLVLHILQFGD